ncbi:SGNH/GDSL hydrolase family protein [Ochrovirga pacifica]|uniref:SGNH/GDSL hydrolase family protein n=1 Tax=Ochrovirga pacifica TaxID=1042376 RepID=UPI000255876B|nr:SGNH/GDSL hydrolase family protein [Ochrovirga pacifica]
MKYFYTLLLCLCSLICCAQTQYKIPNHAKRILFLGNSISYQGHYITYIETVLSLENPNGSEKTFINVGLPSETVSQLSEPNHAQGAFPRPKLQERLGRILDKTKPDFVIACYGINDGIYMPFDSDRFKAYQKGMLWLNNELIKKKLPVLYLTPSPYDKMSDPAYSNVIDLYSNWLMSLSFTKNWNVIDVHEGMKNELLNHRKTKPNFTFTRDGIHPTPHGHWVMAKQILAGLGLQHMLQYTTFAQALQNYQHGEAVYKLINQRQQLMKDAWLTYTGHKRPQMKKGIPIAQAKEQHFIIQQKINNLLKAQ